jgi:stress response protein SCP2
MNIIAGLEKKMANVSKRALQDELVHDISDLQAKISGEIRNIRNKIFAEVQDLESDSHLDSSKIEKAQRKIQSEILGVKDRISFEVEKLLIMVKSYKNLKNKKKHLNAIENLHSVSENGISTLINEVINLLNALRSKLGLQAQLYRRPKKWKLRAGAKKVLNPITQSKPPRFLRICKRSSSPSVSLQTSTTTIRSLPRHPKVCYYVKADEYMPTEKASVIGISLPNSDTRLITPIPSFIDKQKLQDITKSSRCAFNLSSRSAEKLVQELRRIGNS